MSRIGKQPIPLNDRVSVAVAGKSVTVTGPKATMEHELPELIEAQVDGGVLLVSRANDTSEAKALHGLTRSLLSNMVIGADAGFKKELEIRGVGYRAQAQGKKLTMQLGYSRPVEFAIPDDVDVVVAENTRLTVEGADKQRVGQVAATIRAFRKPEPYKGKGIRYVGEYVIQKEGKTV